MIKGFYSFRFHSSTKSSVFLCFFLKFQNHETEIGFKNIFFLFLSRIKSREEYKDCLDTSYQKATNCFTKDLGHVYVDPQVVAFTRTLIFQLKRSMSQEECQPPYEVNLVSTMCRKRSEALGPPEGHISKVGTLVQYQRFDENQIKDEDFT